MSKIKGKTLIEAAEAISGSSPDAAARHQEFIDACEALENNNTAENRERVRDAWADKGQGVSEGFNDAVGGPIRGPLTNEIADALGDVLKRQRDGIDKGYADALDALDKANPGGPGHLGGTERDLCDSLDDALNDVQDIPLSGSPLVLDLDGDGIETVALSEGALFDHEGDGFKEQSGWVRPDDGLLVLDRNGDGNITSGVELFGNNTKLSNGGFASNGFEALQELDSDGNGEINSDDASWQELRVWRDLDGDGISQADELFTLDQSSVSSISVSYSEINESDNGNAILQSGNYTTKNGEVRAVKDVWFNVSDLYGRTVRGDNIAQSILDLPGIRGGGYLKDFHTALSEDSELLTQYTNFLGGASSYSEFVNILFKWANVRPNVSPEEKILDFLRAATGESIDIQLSAARRKDLRESFTEIAERMYGQHLVGADSGFNELARSFVYTEANGAWSVDTSEIKEVLEQKVGESPREALELIQKAQIFARTYELTDLYSWADSGADFISSFFTRESLLLIPQISFLVEASTAPTNIDYIYGSNSSDEIASAAGDDVIVAGGGNDSVTSGNGNNRILLGGGDDKITDNNGSDTIDGGAGDDVINDQGSGTNTLRGGDGNDTITFSRQASNTIEGGTGNDTIKVDSWYYSSTPANTISGGTGNDVITGGYGAETYLFSRGDGQDSIQEIGGSDKIVFGDGIVASDLFTSRSGNDLIIKVNDPNNSAANDQIRIVSWYGSTSYQVETLTFADGSSLTAEQLTLMGNVVHGTEGADTLNGFADSNTLYGYAGNDTLDGGTGNDILDGGAGNDYLNGGAGSDTYLFGRDSGQDTISNYDTAASSLDTLLFGADVGVEDIWFRRNGSNLEVSIVGSGDKATLGNWYSGGNYHLDQFKTADGSTLLEGQVQSLVDAMAAFGVPAGGEGNLGAEQKLQLETVIAANWQ